MKKQNKKRNKKQKKQKTKENKIEDCIKYNPLKNTKIKLVKKESLQGGYPLCEVIISKIKKKSMENK